MFLYFSSIMYKIKFLISLPKATTESRKRRNVLTEKSAKGAGQFAIHRKCFLLQSRIFLLCSGGRAGDGRQHPPRRGVERQRSVPDLPPRLRCTYRPPGIRFQGTGAYHTTRPDKHDRSGNL